MSLYTQTSKMVNKCHNIIPSGLSLSSLPRYPFFFHPSSISLFPFSYLLSSLLPFFLLKHWHHYHLLPLSVGFLGQQTTVCLSGPYFRLQDDTYPEKSNFCRSSNWPCTFWNSLSSGLALCWLLGDELWTTGIFTWSKLFCILSSWATQY